MGVKKKKKVYFGEFKVAMATSQGTKNSKKGAVMGGGGHVAERGR